MLTGVFVSQRKPFGSRIQQLLPEDTITIRPRIGALLADLTEQTAARTADSIHGKFPPVNLYSIDDCLVTQEYVCYDQRYVYTNPSILMGRLRQPGHRRLLSKGGRLFRQFLSLLSGRTASDPSGGASLRLGELVEIARSNTAPINDAYRDLDVFIAHHEGGGTWGHYVIQSLPRIMLARQHRPGIRIALPRHLLARGTPWRQLLDLAGLTDDDLVGLGRDQTYRFRSVSFCDFLWHFDSELPHPVALRYLEEIRRNALAATQGQADHDRVFLERNPRYGRVMSNAGEILGICAESGIVPIRNYERGTADQIRLFSTARLILGTLGSDLTGAVFCEPGTQIVALSPVLHGDTFFFNLAAARGAIWNEILVHDQDETDAVRRNGSFRLDPETLRAALSRLEA